MFQVENLITSSVASLVPRHAPVVVLDLDPRWTHHRAHAYARRHRRRIPVGFHFRAAVAVNDNRIDHLFEGESFLREWQQPGALLFARFAHGHLSSTDGSTAIR